MLDIKKFIYLIVLLFSIISSTSFACAEKTVRNWGERCEFTAQCTDHRLVCEPVYENGPKRCMCDRFHRWNGTELGCAQILTSGDILKLLDEKYNTAQKIEEEANIIFQAQLAAGFVVIAVAFLCSFSILLYCLHIRQKDKKLKDVVRELQARNASAKEKTAPSTSKNETVTDRSAVQINIT